MMRFFQLGRSRGVFTNRHGGESQGSYQSLNLGLNIGDNTETVLKNRQRLAEAVGLEIQWMNQTHSNRVMEVKPGNPRSSMNCDGLIMDSRKFTEIGLALPALGVLVADCVPVLLSSEDGAVIAVVHVGRRGFASGIIRNVLENFGQFQIDTRQVHAAIGPSICGHCYEVPETMRQNVSEYEPSTFAWTKWSTPGLDIRTGVVSQLRRAGVQITFVSKRCTYEDESLFSYRRDGVTGRFAGLVATAS